MPPRKALTKTEQNGDLDAAMSSIDADLANIGSSVEDAMAGIDDAIEQATAETGPSPLDSIEYGKGLEADAKAELSATLKAFKESAKRETDLFQATTDSEYWFCVCFQSREQKDAFLKAVGWFQHGDKYLDGRVVAKKMGVPMPPASVKFVPEQVEKRMAALPAIRRVKKQGQ